MVISCAALGCRKKQNSLDDNGNKISFHRFPRNKDLCQAWLEAAKREDFVPTKFSYLCSGHFTDDQFNRANNPNSSRLKPNAIPTIFKGFNALRKKTPAKVAPKQVLGVAPQQIYHVQNRVKIAPKPNPILISDVATNNISSSTIASASFNQNSFNQSTSSTMPSQQGNGTPVSIYVVHPQPDGSSIVTIPSTGYGSVNLEGITTANVGTLSTANLGTISTANLGAISTVNLGSLSTANIGTIHTAVNGRFNSALGSQSGMSDNLESSSDGDLSSTKKKDVEIKKCQERLKCYVKEIKALHQKNRRQKRKIEKLQEVIKELRNPDFTDEEEDVSEDISEEEIFEELLKHQSESESENSDEYEL